MRAHPPAAGQAAKHYFPIGYTVPVQYEEVLRPSNITRLRQGKVSEAALRYLWFHVSSQAVLRIREVLPHKHPSWNYTQELCQLFDALGSEYSEYRQTDVEAAVADLVKLLHSVGAEGRRKAVRPKALLDNCLKVDGTLPNTAKTPSLAQCLLLALEPGMLPLLRALWGVPKGDAKKETNARHTSPPPWPSHHPAGTADGHGVGLI
ncbi:interleukin-34 isoform X2 [Colius striatus]|uniref:interleukin-34 isoform X2 n=1 Tax=Colius striatus TaxID=57412 RepID=UPI002B1D3A9C|nr:interleukin-34 isoform X2 [Colius striatus]